MEFWYLDLYFKSLGATLKKFSDFLSRLLNLYSDFLKYEMFYPHLLLAPGEVIKFSNLIGFIERIEALPFGAFLKSRPGAYEQQNVQIWC